MDVFDLPAIKVRAKDAQRNRDSYGKESRSRRIVNEESALDVPALIAALEAEQKYASKLHDRITSALKSMDNSTYGDAEVPFRMRAALDPNRDHGKFAATDIDGNTL